MAAWARCRHGKGWFKLNDGKAFPGQSPHRFFESDRETFAYVFYEPLRRPDLTGFSCFSWRDFSSVKIIWKMWTSLDQLKTFGGKKKQENPPEVRPRNGHIQHVCKISESYLLKMAWTFQLWCGKCVICVVAFNYLVSVYDQLWAINIT